jgi:DNA-binding NarL/FixJ family response regulator
MITVLIVDDHTIVRQGMRSMLASVHPDWKIYEAENGIHAILEASKVKPDLILMDHMMPKLDGIKASSVITSDLPASKIIMITMSNRDELMQGARDAGIKCLLPKDAPESEILEKISELTQEITRGKSKKHSKRAPIVEDDVKGKKRLDRHSLSKRLTDREMQIVRLMVEGLNSSKISEHLAISKRTVEGHKLRIMKKYGLHSGSEILRIFLKK